MQTSTQLQGYKIVQSSNKALYSPIAAKCHGRVRYTINKPTKPKKNNGPLFIFKTLDKAKNWNTMFRRKDKTKIYTYTYTPSYETTSWYFIDGIRMDSNPIGNIVALASSVTILRRIK